jgi:hypothetical protein
MEDDGIFYGHVVHFTVFCCILWTFGIVRGNLVFLPHFGILNQEKSGNPGANPTINSVVLCRLECCSKENIFRLETF